MYDQLLLTKQTVPPLRPNLVARSRLLQRLDQDPRHGCRLTLVSAPAGSGKSTLLSQFVTRSAAPVAWLSLDAADNDPSRFWTYLINACRYVLIDIGDPALALLQAPGSLPPETIPTLLINDLAQKNQSLVIFLDDYHTIQNPTIHESMTFLVDYLPHNLGLVVATRSDPPWPLARYRARNQLMEFRAGDLRFSEDEAAEFFRKTMNLELPPDSVAALERRTEGWVAGLQLAAISLRGREDISDFVQAFSGSHLYVADYLLEEVLQGQPQSVQTFLLQTSILPRMTADLCNAVTGRQDGQVMLSALHQANLFIIPLDMQGKWYRYHHLFADLLRSRLMQTMNEGQPADLHRRAAAWHDQNGTLEDAAQHLLNARAYEQVAALVEREGRKMIFSGQVSTLAGWLDALPESVFKVRPRLHIFRLWIDLMQEKGDLSPQALRQNENSLAALLPSAANDRLQVELKAVLCRFVAFSGDSRRAIHLANDALNRLPEDEPALRARAYSALAVANWMDGRERGAEEAYEQTMTLALAGNNYSLAAHASMMMGMSLVDYGRLNAAASMFQSIVELGNQAGQNPFFPAGQGYIGLAGVHLEWNELATAERLLQQGMRLCRLGGLAGLSSGHTAMARLRQAQGDWHGAAAEIDRLGETGVDPSGTARAILLQLARGDLDQAARLARPWISLLESDGGAPQPPLLILEIMRLTLARLYLAQMELQKAGRLLDAVWETAAAPDRRGRLIEVYLLKALVDQQDNQGKVTDAAVGSFLQALELAMPEGYRRIFLEEDKAVRPLLETIISREELSEGLRVYAQQLLAACRGNRGLESPVGPKEVPGMVEPLTPREMEVLLLAAGGASNQEIAEALVISVRTVKKHMTNILGKLGAANRTQAAARALALGLIGTGQ